VDQVQGAEVESVEFRSTIGRRRGVAMKTEKREILGKRKDSTHLGGGKEFSGKKKKGIVAKA